MSALSRGFSLSRIREHKGGVSEKVNVGVYPRPYEEGVGLRVTMNYRAIELAHPGFCGGNLVGDVSSSQKSHAKYSTLACIIAQKWQISLPECTISTTLGSVRSVSSEDNLATKYRTQT